MKKASIITYGCQMNVNESAKIKNIFKHLGYEITENIDESDLIFLNIGMGICIFAREEKELFQAIFLRESYGKRNEVIRIFRDIIKDEMSKDSRFDGLDEDFKTKLYLDAWTFAHGFATLIATNYYEEIKDKEIKERLLEAARTMIYKRLADYKK